MLDRLARRRQICGELASRLAADGQVLVTVTTDLMAARDDLGDQVRVSPRRHSEDEERRLGAELVEQREQHIGLARQRVAGALPVGHAKPPADELVPVLEVDAEKELSVGGRRGPEVTG